MTSLPPEVRGRVVDALGAYIRDRSGELRGALRNYRSFSPPKLRKAADSVLAAADNDRVRDDILDWLDDKPSIPKTQTELLRLYAERPEGWVDRLAGTAPSRPAPAKPRAAKEPVDWRARFEDEKRRHRRIREDLAKAKDAARREVERTKAAAAKDVARVDELTAQVDALRKELTRVTTDLQRAERALEREVRKARKKEESLTAQRDELRKELREARKKAKDLAPGSQSAAPPARRAPARRSRKPPERRTKLRAPAGLLDTAPETLDRWLDRTDVRLLIDGYNVTKGERGFGALNLATQRARLVDEVAKLARRKEVEATIVFDGGDVPAGTRKRSPRGVRVEYSAPDEIADDHLVALLESWPTYPVVVVTSDKELQRRAARLGATVARSDQLMELLRRPI